MGKNNEVSAYLKKYYKVGKYLFSGVLSRNCNISIDEESEIISKLLKNNYVREIKEYICPYCGCMIMNTRRGDIFDIYDICDNDDIFCDDCLREFDFKCMNCNVYYRIETAI